MQRAGQRGLAAAGQAGEEQHQALLVGGGLVALDDRRDVVGEVALAGDAEDLTGGVVLDDPLAEPVVGLGVAAGGQGYGDHVGVVEVGRGREGRPDQRRGGQLGGADAGEGEQQDGLAAGLGADPAEVGVGERTGHRHGDGGVAVLLLDLGRGRGRAGGTRRTRCGRAG